MSHPYRATLLVVTAVVLLTGCSTSLLFQLQVTVVSKPDGKPVPDAQVTFDDAGIVERKTELDYGWPHGRKTDHAGRFVYDYTISPYPNDKQFWFLKVSKEGFEPVVIDIKPAPQPPKNDQGPIPLNVTVELQPSVKPAR